MDELLKLIKDSMRENADISKIEELAKGLNPLVGIDSTEKALEFINKTDILKRANDSAISRAVQSHDDKFTAEKLPELLKAKAEEIRKEINPEETPEQKTIREQKERIDALEANGTRAALKSTLLSKASELGYTGDVDLFLGLGEDKAVPYLEKEAKRFKTAIDERVSTDIKKLYGDAPPKTNVVDPARAVSRSDFDKMSVNQQREIALNKDMTIID